MNRILILICCCLVAACSQNQKSPTKQPKIYIVRAVHWVCNQQWFCVFPVQSLKSCLDKEATYKKLYTGKDDHVSCTYQSVDP